ncbi:2-C-methyl-D-erythritol 4-phosphate cytidylyltransferase/2-C-methyl-D-erythritol 4-phosphate cytidylyltransferase / 2-C-methyl-D-erythritol 2,4-cyclodiphosphate synthase [Selenomonas sp. WCT3]|uniref:2-C-methyl-D-erythritol 4-phosphate cytidylyltransferase n=1 Tax=Selenomonas sp. WCT3 TaxID=3158785 RepID=UPI0008808D2B|nr:2-C-methyl-D-erythritol 4-phosphate cytidylyltransferase/2-C-methyl-D-erythritol 4-phosphate cytidylyltransferase / 2-C-methyl-D-erythritol 2,4-cyclodiphosphate synthase [Selenomonas ruminantium]
MVSVIFPAAGQGKRMNAGINKVFLELADRPMLIRTLQKFSAVPEVGELIVVVGAEEVEPVTNLLKKFPGLKPWLVTEGGSERQYSVWNGLKQVSAEADVVLVHDAARPLVTVKTIEAVIGAAREYGGAIAAVPEKNTVKVVSENGVVKSTPARSTLWAVQTPQGFRKQILVEANIKAEADGFLGTDDASLVERLGRPVHVVMSEYSNIKVTTPEDLLIAEAFLRQEQGSMLDAVRSAAKFAKDTMRGKIPHRQKEEK